MALFTASRRRQAIDRMCYYLRDQFNVELAPVPQNELRDKVVATLARAGSYGVHAERDCCRYLNLAVIYGWDFDQQSDHEWMRQYLTDAGVTSPGQRLHLLIDQCLYRQELAEHNRQLSEELGLIDSAEREVNEEPELILATKA